MPLAQPLLPARLAGAAHRTFVGRRAELATLEQVWSSVCEESRQVVFVGGEPGVGKSRLLAEIAAVLHRQGAVVLLGTCYTDPGVPYEPFVEALEHLLGESPEGSVNGVLSDDAAPLVRLTRLVQRHRPDLRAPLTDVGESRRDLFDAVRDLLLGLCRHRPVVLVLEDLQWAGGPALQLLSHLVQATARGRLLVLASHRTTAPDRSAPLTHLIADLYRQDGVVRLDLSGLETKDIAEYLLVEASLDVAQARRTAALLRDQTGGNPFFLHELWRDLSASGGIGLLGTRAFHAPESVGDTLTGRLSSLTAEQTGVLRLAAVVGQAFDLATLVEVSSLDPAATLAAIDLVVAAGLLESDVGADRYRFTHALARQAVLDRTPTARRVQLHARVVTVLEGRDVDEPAVTASLAHHASEARVLGLTDKAVAYLRRAAGHARRAFAYEEAAELLERAAELAQGRQPPRSEELLLSAASCWLLAGRYEQAMERYEQVSRSSDSRMQARAAIGYEEASWHPGLPGDRAVELLRPALRHLDPDTPLAVRALASLGRALRFTGSPRGRYVSDRALGLARRGGDTGLVAHALATSLWSGLRPDRVGEQLERAAMLRGLADTLGDGSLLGQAAFFQALAAYTAGEPELLEAGVAGLERAARASGEVFYLYHHGCRRYGAAFVRGEFPAAERIAEGMLDLGDEFGTGGTEGVHGLQTYMIRRETGALEGVRGFVTGHESLEHHWAPGLLALYTELGMAEPTGRLLHAVLALHVEVQRETAHWPAVLAYVAEAAMWLRDRPTMERARALLAPYEGLNLMAGQFVALFGAADRYLAALDSLLGAPDVEKRFVAALQMDRRMAAPVHQAATLAEWSLHMRRAGRTGDAERLRDEALGIARPLGQARVLRSLGSEMAPVQAPPPEHPDGLTERELEVLGLLAEGLSNREIGERLFISQNTAANHVRSILVKTGAANRTQAAMYAARHGLDASPR